MKSIKWKSKNDTCYKINQYKQILIYNFAPTVSSVSAAFTRETSGRTSYTFDEKIIMYVAKVKRDRRRDGCSAAAKCISSVAEMESKIAIKNQMVIMSIAILGDSCKIYLIIIIKIKAFNG